jgi:hypothetical protein
MGMTLREAEMYYVYARDNPPVRAMVAAYLGVKPAKRRPDDMNDLLALFGGPGVLK